MATLPDVAECAVIGIADALEGQVPRGFVVLKAGTGREPSEVEAELVQLVRERIGAVASLKEVSVAAALPQTRSGKILRKTMLGIADGLDEPILSTIDDPSTIESCDRCSAAPVTPHEHQPPEKGRVEGTGTARRMHDAFLAARDEPYGTLRVNPAAGEGRSTGSIIRGATKTSVRASHHQPHLSSPS